MRITISISDAVGRDLERVRATRHINVSALCSKAIQAVIRKHDHEVEMGRAIERYFRDE